MSTDVLVLLKYEHRELRRLLRGVRRPTDPAGPPGIDALRHAVDTLADHLHREREALTRVAAAVPDDVPAFDTVAEDEEGAVVAGWSRLLAEPAASEVSIDALAADVEALLRQHVERQETRLFPNIRHTVGRRALAAVGATLAGRVAGRGAEAAEGEQAASAPATVRHLEDHTVVHVIGAADEVSAATLRGMLLDAAAGPAHLVVDLSAVTQIDSAGLRVLLDVQRSLGPQASLRLVVPEGAFAIRRVLRISGLHKIFQVVTSVDEARSRAQRAGG